MMKMNFYVYDVERVGNLKLLHKMYINVTRVVLMFLVQVLSGKFYKNLNSNLNPYPTAFPYGNGMVLHFYQQQESSTTETVHRVINKRLKTYV